MWENVKRFTVAAHYAQGGIMRFAVFTLALAGVFGGSALGQTPTVTGLLNNYSNTLPGLPNYGIAEGSIFVIYGTNFSSTQSALQYPPPATLNGVSISVTVNGTITSPLFYYLYPTQIAAVLPSATPVGTGTLTVTNSAGTSAAFPITVVQSAFGLLTTNGGTGPAQGYDASIDPTNHYLLFNFTEAANPGDILELWGTGLGPVTNDATGVAVAPTAQVFIGGVAATVQYAGRSGFVGLDQINVVVPSGITGCYVSAVVQTGNYVSNFATIPIAASGGRTCTDANNPITSSILGKIASSGTLSIGTVGLTETTQPAETIDGIQISAGGTTDRGAAGFFTITYSQLNSGAYSTASVGSCAVTFFNASESSPTPPTTFTFTYLNAGPDVNINGPDGLLAMPLSSAGGVDIYATPTSNTSFIPASGGTFNFDNGTGGPAGGVGPFTAQLQVASPLVWSNMNSISTVTRANGLPINWTGGDPTSFVSIAGTSFGVLANSSTDFVATTFTCEAPASAQTFTVPSAVLLSMPASASISGISFSTLTVSNVSAPATFTATGIDLGLVFWSSASTISVTYQ
jgi:uncharacterized protein (TIGR03437 family)